jgi:molecular chaperone IbpA
MDALGVHFINCLNKEVIMTDLINLNTFLDNAIGFESFFDRFKDLRGINAGFPHYNIKKAGEEKYILEMAVAGYKKSDIKVTVENGVLSVEGQSSDDKEAFVHQGIAKRAFQRQLQLSEYVECTGAKLEDGMLKVDLNYNPPEDKKPKKITVK